MRTVADYLEDGSFSELEAAFQGDTGRRVERAGHWEFAKQAKDRFRLTLFSDGQQWNGDFTVVNRDRIHNIYDNYDAVRIPRYSEICSALPVNATTPGC
jgi:hypothetical protein